VGGLNAIEIEEAVSELVARPFDASEFPYAFLEAFGNTSTTLKRLRAAGKSTTNYSDIQCDGGVGVLQRNNIHLATCAPGEVEQTFAALRASPATAKHRKNLKFLLATDGDQVAAEDLASDEELRCDYTALPDRFAFFLPLAGISIARRIADNAFDIRATRKLNQLYLQLVRDNPEWGTEARAEEMSLLMVRLIFCFFAEDTDIFQKRGLFTQTLEQMSDETNTGEVLAELFRAMDLDLKARAALPPAKKLRSYADKFPYVNGGLFRKNSSELPTISRSVRGLLLSLGSLNWRQINPDIFGSMIQAVTDEAERSHLGLHYTSVPNILKVLGPLFLDGLRTEFTKLVSLSRAAEMPLPVRRLRELRRRLARIRVFDPACGSGNFLVIAYKELRKLEHEINTLLGERERRTGLCLDNFRGIELLRFPVEIARLALTIAEYQCDVESLGQLEARLTFLPLSSENSITCGNALRLDWLTLWPPKGKSTRRDTGELWEGDPFAEPSEPQADVEFKDEGSEIYLCGNPPYRGSTWQSPEQKADMREVFASHTKKSASLDYVAAWFFKASGYIAEAAQAGVSASAAFVATNSINQGQQVPILWPLVFERGQAIHFARTSFKWANLASHNAGVTVSIIGITVEPPPLRRLFSLVENEAGKPMPTEQRVPFINAYLAPGADVIVSPRQTPLSERAEMIRGNMPVDGGNLLLGGQEKRELVRAAPEAARFIRRFVGSEEFIQAKLRYCLWICDDEREDALAIPQIAERVERVRKMRLGSPKKPTVEMAQQPHRFGEVKHPTPDPSHTIVMPAISSENRDYLPVGLLHKNTIGSNKCYLLYDAPLWCLAILASRMHLVWVAAVCGRLKTDYSYSNTLGWNIFPFPEIFLAADKEALTQCAESILIAREAEFPKSLAELYKPGAMPERLRMAHAHNDEVLERAYIGRRFKNDSERLEMLFALYARATTDRPISTPIR